MQCKRCLMDTSIADVKLNENGTCNFCDLHDSLEKSSQSFDWYKRVKKIKREGKKYDCLIGISGGLDSSLLLEYTVKKWHLKPLVIHFQNNWNVPEAEHNMKVMVDSLGVDFIEYKINQQEYDDLCLSFLLASVSDADIPNDMAMGEMMLRTANQYGIKYIFNGHNFRTEGSSPLCWSYMDAKYVDSVFKRFNSNKPLQNYPLLTFWKQLYYTAVKGIRQERPFYYMNIDFEAEKQRLATVYGWKDYGGKHMENIYTAFIGAYYLPKKFGIDKSILYNSALIRSGKLRKEDVKAVDSGFKDEWVDMVCYRLGIKRHKALGSRGYSLDEIMQLKWNTFEDYETYHNMFKRYRWLFWILTKMHLLPYNFYHKYCK